MSSIYNIDFSLAAERVSPPAKRKPLYLSWLKVLLSPLQWLRSRIFEDYVNGSTAPDFFAGNTYSFGAIVRFENAVYMCIDPVLVAGPFNKANWYMIQENYIGLRERLNYNGQTIVLEEILNKAFNTGEDIFIENINNNLEMVVFFNPWEGYPPVYMFKETGEPVSEENLVYFFNEAEYLPEFDFIVVIPDSLVVDRDGDLDVDEDDLLLTKKLVSVEVDKYKIAGTNYTVMTEDEFEE